MNTFDRFTISPLIHKAILEMGFTKPTPIQEQTLPVLLSGEKTDLIGLAATGTGKTAAFGIPLLEKIDTSFKGVQGLVLCPTRELANQVCGQINLMGKYCGIKAVAIYGGASYSDQLHGLRTAAIVVATPGRLVDLLNRKSVSLKNVRTIVLDEADEMISMGFKEALETILNSTPSGQSQTWLFSATMSPDVRKVADKYLKNPKFVQVNRTEVLSSTVEQIFYPVRESNKPDILCKIIDSAESFYGIIFCQTKQLVSDVTHFLSDRGFKVDCLHGDKDQRSRELTINAFRQKRVSILVCTDVASRGLDVHDVSHVVNYSIPRELEVYVHRIGRTARSGKKGIAVSLVTPTHRHLIGQLERITKSKIRECPLPNHRDIGVKKVSAVLEKFKLQNGFQRAQELLSEEWKNTLKEMKPEEVVSRFLTMNLSDLFEDRVREKVDFNSPRPPSKHRERGGKGYADHKDRNRRKGKPSKWSRSHHA